MVSRKISKPTARERDARPVARPARHRAHSLAPEHIGEAGSAALLAVAVLGMAAFIAALAMIVSGLTVPGRYGSSPPPNVGELGGGQVLGGIGLLVLGVVLVGSALAVLADVRHSRPLAAAASGLSAVLSAAGVLLAVQAGAGVVLPLALAVATIIFGAAAVLLFRRR